MKQFLKFLIVVIGLFWVFARPIQASFWNWPFDWWRHPKSKTIELLIKDGNEPYSQVVFDSWTGTNLLPGEKIPEAVIGLKNDGVSGKYLSFKVSYTGSDDLADKIIFEGNDGLRFGGSGLKNSVDIRQVLISSNQAKTYKIYRDDGRLLKGIAGQDQKLSLKELKNAGKLRIVPGTRNEGIAKKSQAKLWINGKIDPALTIQQTQIKVTIEFRLE